jgi:uncharacterized protein YjbJ (UPF0337 family)
VLNADEAKGRIKEAAGDLTANKDLQREGKVDQASGKAKDAIDKQSQESCYERLIGGLTGGTRPVPPALWSVALS